MNEGTPKDRAEFDQLVDAAMNRSGYRPPCAFGIGVATVADADQSVLDTWFAAVNLQENQAMAALLAEAVGHGSGPATHRMAPEVIESVLGRCEVVAGDGSPHPNLEVLSGFTSLESGSGVLPTHRVVVVTFIDDLGDAPVDIHDGYLRLHLLSHRLVKPHGCNLDGLFGLLNNTVWTSAGPCDVASFPVAQRRAMAAGTPLVVNGVDKFPRMLDYVVPSGVRVADGSRVRLGAHLAEGTTVMHEGFVNFNAGTLGASMVEGRISAGVVVGSDSDLGGGASVMGTLSGGGKEVISVGRDCLLGANSGIGISLGDGCVVEAGLYVTAGTRVTTSEGEVVKASELSGASGMLFRRNSTTGAVEVLPREGTWSEGLNEALHAN